MAIATVAAAVAAGCSAYAAFRQERATFTSALYSKQVDEFATFLQAASDTQYRIEWRLSGGEQKADSSAIETQFQVSGQRLALVVPDNIRTIIFSIMINADHARGLAEQAANAHKPETAKAAQPYLNLLESLRDGLSFCAWRILSSGHYIDAISFGICKREEPRLMPNLR